MGVAGRGPCAFGWYPPRAPLERTAAIRACTAKSRSACPEPTSPLLGTSFPSPGRGSHAICPGRGLGHLRSGPDLGDELSRHGRCRRCAVDRGFRNLRVGLHDDVGTERDPVLADHPASQRARVARRRVCVPTLYERDRADAAGPQCCAGRAVPDRRRHRAGRRERGRP